MKNKKVGCLVLFVVVVGGIAAILYPAISGLNTATGAMKFGNTGRCLYYGLYESSMEYEALNTNSAVGAVWPAEGQYISSTDFFKAVVTNDIIKGVDFTFFGGPGVKNQKDTMNSAEFTAENNAWGVVVLPGGTNSYKESPFLFSRNIGFGSPLGPPKAGDTIADMTGLRKGVKPFGNKVGVIVTFGGAVKILPRKVATQTNFNPKGETLKFIMP